MPGNEIKSLEYNAEPARLQQVRLRLPILKKYHVLHNSYLWKSCGYRQFILDSKSFCVSLFLIGNLEVQAAKKYFVTNNITCAYHLVTDWTLSQETYVKVFESQIRVVLQSPEDLT